LSEPAADAELLEVEDLSVAFPSDRGPVSVVRGVSFTLGSGEMVGLVGESGSGKSLTALSILGLVPDPGRVTGGRVRFRGRDLTRLSDSELRRYRGARIAMIFQEPGTALDPVFTVGFQVAEAIRVHRRISRSRARKEAEELLERVAIPDPDQRLDDYPHQLSGGQRQRVMIAMALAAGPDLLLADEPTTALDVTIQAQILELLESLRRELDLTVLLITHDLAVVAETCERVVVMYAGEVVEQAPARSLFTRPAHPYTRGLLSALPRLGGEVERGRLTTIPGTVPDPEELPSGCPFHPRCPDRMPVCDRRAPALYRVSDRVRARCFLHENGLSERESARDPVAEPSAEGPA
jgi:oligopeptide/dipeptide ABC transporter ATP-binding protein